MIREYISIPEIIIKNQAPQEIMRKAYNNISDNYGNTSAGLTGFYREAVMNKSELQIYSEAILRFTKVPIQEFPSEIRLRSLKAER